MSEHTPQRTGLISNILAVAGFIILIAIVVWGAFHFLNIASSGFSSLFNRNTTSAIQLSLSQRTIASGQPLDVSWRYAPASAGTFSLLYQCRDSFQFKMVNSAGVVSNVTCGSAQTLGDATTRSVRLVPALAGTTQADVQISVIFQETGANGTSTASTRVQGNATVTVTPSTGPGTTTTQTPTVGTSVTTPVTPSKPDLSVRIIAVGVIDPYTNIFVSRAPMSERDIVAVKFDISNSGGPTGAWYFTAQLPTSPATPYVSPQQRSLGTGDHIENTLRFNQVAQGGGMFTVSVDPSNAVGELNESNNYTSQWIAGLSGLGGYGHGTYPYPYPSHYQGTYYPYQY